MDETKKPTEPTKETKADEEKKANEQKMVKVYMDLTGSTEAAARNVFMHVEGTEIIKKPAADAEKKPEGGAENKP